MASDFLGQTAMNDSSMRELCDSTAEIKGGLPNTAYPHLLRIFTGSIVAAALCGLAALATVGDKGLHPAPFLALATLLAIAAAGAFLCMLMRLIGETVALWWKR